MPLIRLPDALLKFECNVFAFECGFLFWIQQIFKIQIFIWQPYFLRRDKKYLNLRSEDEWRSYGVGTTWGWVINNRIFIFGWTIPLKQPNSAVIPRTWQPCPHAPPPFEVWLNWARVRNSTRRVSRSVNTV